MVSALTVRWEPGLSENKKNKAEPRLPMMARSSTMTTILKEGPSFDKATV